MINHVADEVYISVYMEGAVNFISWLIRIKKKKKDSNYLKQKSKEKLKF